MEKQKDALIRIVDSLQRKYDETASFQSELVSDMQQLNEAYEMSRADLNAEFDKLYDILNMKKESLMRSIEKELLEKQEHLKTQLKGYEDARNDASELITLAQKASEITTPTEFNQAAVSIKSRITMSSIFRLSTKHSVTDLHCRMVADSKREQILLDKLDFLPVPETPSMSEEYCTVANNCVTCEWRLKTAEKEEDETDAANYPSPIESFLFQYRQVPTDQASQEVPWKTTENIKETKHIISNLKFTYPFVQVRVQAWNRAVGGELSNVVTLPTPAFNFALDGGAAHANLKATGPHLVEWDPSAIKPIEARVKSAGSARTSSPSKSPKKMKHKDRFIGESYTILADTSLAEDEAYFEVTPHKDCKTFAVGITSNTLSRYDQLGRTATSWCLFASRWIQNSFVAKHNNKMKNLDHAKVPSRIGVYFNNEQGFLAFYDTSTHECLHLFKQTKCSSPLLPGFSVWCGSMEIHTGLQVPLWVDTQPLSSPKGKSPSVASSDNSEAVTVDLTNQ